MEEFCRFCLIVRRIALVRVYRFDQAVRHIGALRGLGVPVQGHGMACIERVQPWPSPERAGDRIQTCPCCGLTEAAGDFCTRCLARTGPGDWYVRERAAAQQAHTATLLGRKGGVHASIGPTGASEAATAPGTPSRPPIRGSR